MEVLRPRCTKYANPMPYYWVHIANDDSQPLCGKVHGDGYELRQENMELGALTEHSLCGPCAAAHFDFSYETLQAGQARRYADSWYKYKITDLADTPRDRAAVLEFCRTWIKASYDRADMPNPFAPELVECNRIADNEWIYSVRSLYTG